MQVQLQIVILEMGQNFQDLIIWQKSHLFVLGIYKLTSDFPHEEKYGLTSQIRRAAVSIAANLTEGLKKRSDKDKIKFLNISQGSMEECKYYMILARDLGYGENQELHSLSIEISKLLNTFIGIYSGKRNIMTH